MDFAGLEGNWTGSLRIAPLDVDHIDRALEGHAVWQSAGIRFPLDYAASLTRLRRRLLERPTPVPLSVELVPSNAANLIIYA